MVINFETPNMMTISNVLMLTTLAVTPPFSCSYAVQCGFILTRLISFGKQQFMICIALTFTLHGLQIALTITFRASARARTRALTHTSKYQYFST